MSKYNKQDNFSLSLPQVGIEQLLHSGAYLAAFPLHDGPETESESKHKSITTTGLSAAATSSSSTLSSSSATTSSRALLLQDWGRFGAWWKPQPLQRIRAYFGEKIGECIFLFFFFFYLEKKARQAASSNPSLSLFFFLIFSFCCCSFVLCLARVLHNMALVSSNHGDIHACLWIFWISKSSGEKKKKNTPGNFYQLFVTTRFFPPF